MIYDRDFYRGKVFGIEDTRIRFSNFAGIPNPNSKYPSNDRTVNVEIPPTMVQELEDIGINVRSYVKNAGTDSEEVIYHVPLKIAFRDKFGELKPEHLQPKIYVHEEDNLARGILYDEEMIGGKDGLDSYPIKSVDVTFAPTLNNVGTITLYLRTIHMVHRVTDDPYAAKYRAANIDEEVPF